MLTGGTLSAAYGRIYTSRTSILNDLNDGKDFVMRTFDFEGYCSIRDLADGIYQVRYNRDRSVVTVKVNGHIAR